MGKKLSIESKKAGKRQISCLLYMHKMSHGKRPSVYQRMVSSCHNKTKGGSMMRTIRVTGRGQLKIRPDVTRITISLDGLHRLRLCKDLRRCGG